MLNFVILFLKNKNGLSPLLFELVLVPAKMKVDAKAVLAQSNCILAWNELVSQLEFRLSTKNEIVSLYLLNQVSFGQELKIHITKSTFTLIKFYQSKCSARLCLKKMSSFSRNGSRMLRLVMEKFLKFRINISFMSVEIYKFDSLLQVWLRKQPFQWKSRNVVQYSVLNPENFVCENISENSFLFFFLFFAIFEVPLALGGVLL